MASFVIRDRLDRIYPLPAKRLAPDFFFQPQIYRADGETVQLPAGYYTVQYSGGPEYVPRTQEFVAGEAGPNEISFQLDRWIDPSQYGWYSGDHHIHAAGCSHYMNPTEGVEPKDMIRQILGESLNTASVLTWGPDYYYQKQFFSGSDHPLSKPDRIMHYDLEVSGFPSSHAGHIVLLNLKQQDYPGAKRIEDWPTWDLPILRWAKSQGAVVGFAHSGWGLQVSGKELPSLRNAGVRRHRRQRVHRRCDAPRYGGLHFSRGHAVRMGAEHLVPHAERGLPDPDRGRDRFPVHLRRPRRDGPDIREDRRAD